MKLLFLIFFLFPLMLNAQTYTFSGGKNNVVHIIAAKVLTKAYARAGIKTRPYFTSLSHSLKLSNRGDTDGELARVKKISAIYPNLVQVPVVLTHVEAIAYSKNKNLNIKNWNDLRGHRFLIVKGAKFIEQATESFEKELVDTFEEAFKKLSHNKTEIIVIPKKAAVRLILQQENIDIQPVSDSLQTLDMYHFVHKKNAHLIPIITPILEKMSKSGEIQYISNSYLRSVTH